MRDVIKHPEFWAAVALFLASIFVPQILYYTIIFALCLFIAALLIGGGKLVFWAVNAFR